MKLDFTGAKLPWPPYNFMVRNRNNFFSRQLVTDEWLEDYAISIFLNEFVSLLTEE